MAETRCKYYKQKRQVSYDGGATWQDVIPYEYQKGELYEHESADCGALVVYRWVNMDASVDYYCEGTTKYYKQKRQVSYDGGQTWIDVSPAEYQRGGVAEQRSTDCGYVPPTPQYRWIKSDDTICVEILYRWVNMDASVDYYCEGTTKYYKQKKQVSYDGGQTWIDVSPAEYQKGGVAEEQSTDCGYVPPTPTDKKFVYTAFERIYETECNGDGTLTKAEVFKDDSTARYMTSAIIGDCVTSIGGSAFYWATGLTSVTIPDSVVNIGNSAFYNCVSLASITIPNSVTTIGGWVFNNSSGLTSIVMPNSVTSIGNACFADCYSLTSVGPFGSGASVEIPDMITSIPNDSFTTCSGLTSLTLSNKITSVGDRAFMQCHNLTNIDIPDSVTHIGEHAFAECNALISIRIGRNATSFSNYAFAFNEALTSVVCLATTPPALGGESVFSSTNNCPIYVPAQSLDAYKTASRWSSYASRIQAIP